MSHKSSFIIIDIRISAVLFAFQCLKASQYNKPLKPVSLHIGDDVREQTGLFISACGCYYVLCMLYFGVNLCTLQRG